MNKVANIGISLTLLASYTAICAACVVYVNEVGDSAVEHSPMC